MSPDGRKSAEHSETSQIDGCLGRLFLLVRDIAVPEALS